MGGLRDFVNSKQGQGVAIVVVLLVVAATAYVVKSSMAPVIDTNSRIFFDAGATPPDTFRATLSYGQTIPIKAPSGGMSGYPAEACYWTKDGHVKADPTYVLLNDYLGKRTATFCPDCGRLVVLNNPGAAEGARPPPTQEEYLARHGSLDAMDRR